jgi:hypothetical protein
VVFINGNKMSFRNSIYTIERLSLETDHIGVGELQKFYSSARTFSNCTITLNISPLNHVDANLSAMILAIAYKLRRERNLRLFIELGDGKGVFFRNGLISHLQGNGNINKYVDERKSTIPLSTYYPSQDEEYCQYLRSDFFSHRGLDNLSKTTKESLINHYIEVFSNVGMHAGTNHPVFTCGQFFPEKNVLKFSLIDLGVGFLKNIYEFTDGKITDDKSAIIWATEGINTTKNKSVYGPGGTGLKLIKKYCNENNGSLHICSGIGYVNMLNNKTLEYNLATPFPGSMINIIMRKI